MHTCDNFFDNFADQFVNNFNGYRAAIRNKKVYEEKFGQNSLLFNS